MNCKPTTPNLSHSGRCAIYTRSASTEQGTESLDLQEQLCRATVAKRNDMQIVDIVKEGEVIAKKAILNGRKGGHTHDGFVTV
jgi:hypothetical protein